MVLAGAPLIGSKVSIGSKPFDDRRCDERGREETTHLEDKAFGGTVDHGTVVATCFDIIDQIINVFLQA